MKSVSVEEFELLSFFEVEPSRADSDVPWPYNDYTYNLTLGSRSLVFSIAPAYRDVSLSITGGDDLEYQLTANDVFDVRYEKRGDRELLVISLTEREDVWLQIRPAISIRQELGLEA